MTPATYNRIVAARGPLAGTGPCARMRLPLAAALAVLVALALSLAAPAPARADGAGGAEVAEEGAAVDTAAGIGIRSFTRYQKGAQRPVDGTDIGYRYPQPEGATLTVLVTETDLIVYLDAAAASEAGLDTGDEGDVAALLALVEDLDEEASRGGALLRDVAAGLTLTVTTERSVEIGPYRYLFAHDAGGRVYCAVQPAGDLAGREPSAAAEAAGLDLSAGALWCDGARLVPASEAPLAAPPGPLEQLQAFFADVDYRPFWVSLRTSAVALAITFVLGLIAAWRTMGTSSRLKGVLDSVFTIPMVLPPTVCGFLLLLLFGQATPVGQWFIAHGVSLVFTWEAAVISAVVVSFPLMYRTALGAFESLDAPMLDAARTLGWPEARIFCRLMMPLAWPSIAAGTVLAFARAMGEFGCTLFFAGNYAGITQTIPIAIYFEWMSGNTDVALFWVVVVILMSFAVVLFINLYTARSQRFRERGGVVPRRARRAGGADGPADEAAEAGGDALRIDAQALRELIRASAADADGGGAPGTGEVR